MEPEAVLAGRRPETTRESWRVAYWTGVLLVLALLVVNAVGNPAATRELPLGQGLFVALLALSLLVAAASGALGGSIFASAANPAAVAGAVVVVAGHRALVGATTPDQSPVGFVALAALLVGAAAAAGAIAHGVGAVGRALVTGTRAGGG